MFEDNHATVGDAIKDRPRPWLLRAIVEGAITGIVLGLIFVYTRC